LGSARIEGNHTTLADLVETTVQGGVNNGDPMKEITNIEEAMKYVEDAMEPGAPLTEAFIRDLHSIAVKDLEREGDKTPGAYREAPVRIAMSAHLPPEALAVPQYMKEFQLLAAPGNLKRRSPASAGLLVFLMRREMR